jgi:uncharacterized protein YciI
MFVVLLKFSEKRDKARQFMTAHNEWIERGFADGVFLLVGSLQPGLGGAIVAHDTVLSDLQRRVDQDPFVEQGIVSTEIIEIAPATVDDRLGFLRG